MKICTIDFERVEKLPEDTNTFRIIIHVKPYYEGIFHPRTEILHEPRALSHIYVNRIPRTLNRFCGANYTRSGIIAEN